MNSIKVLPKLAKNQKTKQENGDQNVKINTKCILNSCVFAQIEEKNGKAGIDNIHTETIKLFCNYILQAFTHII